MDVGYQGPSPPPKASYAGARTSLQDLVSYEIRRRRHACTQTHSFASDDFVAANETLSPDDPGAVGAEEAGEQEAEEAGLAAAAPLGGQHAMLALGAVAIGLVLGRDGDGDDQGLLVHGLAVHDVGRLVRLNYNDEQVFYI